MDLIGYYYINNFSNLDKDDRDCEANVISPPNFHMMLNFVDTIGDYYNSSEGRILFTSKKTIYNHLSRQNDHFNMILSSKICISTIVNKAEENNCEMNSHQTILIMNRMQYLKHACLYASKAVFG